MQIPGPVVHWVSLVQPTQVFAVQIGVLPEQSELVMHCTHWPSTVPLVAHTGLAPLQGPTTPPSLPPPSTRPPSLDPPSLPLPPPALAPATLQPWHLLATQKFLPGVGHSLFCTHSTHRPEPGSHTGATPEQTPPSPVAEAHDTQVFCAEQKGAPASLSHWLLALHDTHLAFTQ